MQLTIPTSQLKKLLDDLPDVKLQLSTFACEKIAEEMQRKANSMLQNNMIHALVEKVIETSNEQLCNTWKFPDQAKYTIKTIATEAVTTALATHSAKTVDRLNEIAKEKSLQFQNDIRDKFKAREEEFSKWAQEEVRRLARDEFIKTLESVARLNLNEE